MNAGDSVRRLERGLLGALLLSPSLVFYAERLSPVHFASRERGIMFDRLKSLTADRVTVNEVVMAHAMRDVPCPGTHWHAVIGSLLDDGTALAGDPALVESYARLIREAAIERELAKRGIA